MASQQVDRREEEGMDENLLSCYTSLTEKVGAWSIELAAESMEDDGPVDSEFGVQINYMNYKDGADENRIFYVKREEIKEYFEEARRYTTSERWETSVVLDWLNELGVSQHETAYGVTVDIVLDGFEKLLEEVESCGRKSLTMSVDIEVFGGGGEDEDEDEDDGDDQSMVDVDEGQFEEEEGFEFEEEEQFEFEEEEEGFELEDEEVEKENIERAKMMLSTSRVKSVKVCSSTSYEEVGCCVVCMENFEDDDQMEVVAVLPCSHILHQQCLLPWVAKGKSSCPLCRTDMFSPVHFKG